MYKEDYNGPLYFYLLEIEFVIAVALAIMELVRVCGVCIWASMSLSAPGALAYV